MSYSELIQELTPFIDHPQLSPKQNQALITLIAALNNPTLNPYILNHQCQRLIHTIELKPLQQCLIKAQKALDPELMRLKPEKRFLDWIRTYHDYLIVRAQDKPKEELKDGQTGACLRSRLQEPKPHDLYPHHHRAMKSG